MKNRPTTPRPLALLAGLALLAPAVPAAQEAPPSLSAETFGRASGDVPMRGLGLVLELVQSDPTGPRLRLFGGAAGHPAAILVSTERPASPAAGPGGTELLVGSQADSIQGSFDWRGIFEVPLEGLEELPAEGRIYAQGLHTGILRFADGPLVQASHGIEIQRRAAGEGPLGFDDLLPHLPQERELGAAADLAELLQGALDSAGDSLRLSMKVEASVGLGIEVVDAKVGAGVAAEFSVTRTEEGLYEVAVGADVANLAGVSVGTGAEAGLEGGFGGTGTLIYRFHSAPGAARGILGMTVAMAFPAASPGADLLESGILGDPAERMAELQATIESLDERAAELERTLIEVLDARVAAAEASYAQTLRGLAAAQQALAHATWWERPARFARLAAQQGVVAIARAGLNLARAARVQGEAALSTVRACIEAKRQELSRFFQAIARVGRIGSAIAQLRPYTVEHYDGEELSGGPALELEAKLGLPFVDVKGLESGLKGEVARSVAARIERRTLHRPLRVTMVGTLEREVEVTLAHLQGVGATRARTIEVAQTFERRASGWKPAGLSLSLSLDTQAVRGAGLGAYYEQGLGRSWSLSLTDDAFLTAAGRDALGSIEGLVERIGAMEVAMELQDRRQESAGFAFSVDVSGNGGGIEIEAEWADQGRLLSRSATVEEAVATVLHGAGQLIDPGTGMVTKLE